MSQASVFSAIETYARAVGSTLAPDWDAPLAQFDLGDDDEALELVRVQLRWDRPDQVTSRPQPGQFPLLVHDPQRGWMVARQWISETELALIDDPAPLVWDEGQSYFSLHIPDPLHAAAGPNVGQLRAIGVFAKAIKRRSRVLVVAGVVVDIFVAVVLFVWLLCVWLFRLLLMLLLL